ncbi:MAG: VTT domain-containing protein [Actinobacteria bacterium]|nr:VTT domain-containing protein [Actinomycetota bacterium]
MTALALPSWLDPAALIHLLGNWWLWGVAFIIFAECGLFSVLPGDSLLFTVGLFAADSTISFGSKPATLGVVFVVLTIAAVLGNVVGYWIGYVIGPPLFKPRTSWVGRKLFAPQYVTKTHEFFDRYGSRALILARFVPLVRTFVTLVAGVGRMSFRRFIAYTAIGGVVWVALVTLLGFFLGNIRFVRTNIDLVLVVIVLVSLLPMGLEYLRHRRAAKKTKATAAAAEEADPA